MRSYVLENKSTTLPVSRDIADTIVGMRQRVYFVAFKMLGNRSDAEDITQETLTRAWSNLPYYDPARSLENWILRIGTNLCIDHIRRRRRRTEFSLDNPLSAIPGEEGVGIEFPDHSQNPETLLLNKEIEEGLQRKIQSLPAVYRNCILLRGEERSYEEIAATLRCSLGTVRSRVHRAREVLRRGLEE